MARGKWGLLGGLGARSLGAWSLPHPGHTLHTLCSQCGMPIGELVRRARRVFDRSPAGPDAVGPAVSSNSLADDGNGVSLLDRPAVPAGSRLGLLAWLGVLAGGAPADCRLLSSGERLCWPPACPALAQAVERQNASAAEGGWAALPFQPAGYDFSPPRCDPAELAPVEGGCGSGEAAADSCPPAPPPALLVPVGCQEFGEAERAQQLLVVWVVLAACARMVIACSTTHACCWCPASAPAPLQSAPEGGEPGPLNAQPLPPRATPS